MTPRAVVHTLTVNPAVDVSTTAPRVALELVAGGRAEVVVISLVAEGALLATAGTVERLAAPPVAIGSRIGAGDSMVAGIVFGRASGWSWRDAVLLGLAAGSATVMAHGTNLARPDDVRRLYAHLRAGGTRPPRPVFVEVRA